MAKSFKDLQKSMVAFDRGSSPRVREMTRDAFFDGRQDVSADRLARRAFQEQRTTDFKNKFTKQVPNTGGTLLQMASDAPRSLTAERERLAKEYGPTFREIGSDINYGLGNIAKGFAEKGPPLISLLKGLYGKGKDFFTQGIPSALKGKSQFDNSQVGIEFPQPSSDTKNLFSSMNNSQEGFFPYIADNKALPSLVDLYNFSQNPEINTKMGNIRLDNAFRGDPSFGYNNTVIINGVPVDLNATIGRGGDLGIAASLMFKNGGTVDKYSGLGYKLR